MKKYMRLSLLLLFFTPFLFSCRSSSMPCPSFGHSKANAYQLGNGPKVKYDKNGIIKK